MNNNNVMKEKERYLKRVLKNKVSINQGTVIAYLIAGFFGVQLSEIALNRSLLSQEAEAAYLAINNDGTKVSYAGNRSDQPGGGGNDSVILASVGSNVNNVNTINNTGSGIVAIGSGANTRGYSTAIAIGNSSHVGGGQGVAVGAHSYAGDQATALGTDTYALGQASIAIGADDIADFTDNVSEADFKSFYNAIYREIKNKDGREVGEAYGNQSGTHVNNKYSPTVARGSGAIAIGARTLANAKGSTAMGTLAYALGERSTALGTYSRADGLAAAALGSYSRALGNYATTIGTESRSSGVGAATIGSYSNAIGDGATAIGSKTHILAANSVGVGNNIQILKQGGMGYGYKAYAGGDNSIAIGSDVYANTKMTLDATHTAPNKTLNDNNYQYYIHNYDSSRDNDSQFSAYLEQNATSARTNAKVDQQFYANYNTYEAALEGIATSNATIVAQRTNRNDLKSQDKTYTPSVVQENGKNAIVIGSRSMALGDNSIAFGRGSYGLAQNAFAMGSYSYADAKNSMAIGMASRALGENTIAMGVGTGVGTRANNTVAIGTGSIAYGEGSILMGTDSRSGKTYNGQGTIYDGRGNIVIGNTSKVYGNQNVTFGNNITVNTGGDTSNTNYAPTTTGNMALGTNITINKGVSSSVAIGTNSEIGSSTVDNNAISNSAVFGVNAKVLNASTTAMVSDADLATVTGIPVTIGNPYRPNANPRDGQTGSNAMAIGNGSIATLENSVALGVGSKTDYTQDSLSKPGWVAPGAFSIPTSGNIGVISVGSNGRERRIVNLASGAEDTDAVNVAQLRSLSERLQLAVGSTFNVSGNGRYVSVERSFQGNVNTDGSANANVGDAGKISLLVDRREQFQNYVEAKSQLMYIQARKNLNNEVFDTTQLAELERRVTEYEQNPVIKSKIDSNSALKRLVIPTTRPQSDNVGRTFAKAMADINLAKNTDNAYVAKMDGTGVLTREELDAITASNYESNTALGKDSTSIGFQAKTDVNSQHSIAIGHKSNIAGTATETSVDSIAIGREAKIGTFGANGAATAGADNAITIGATSNVTKDNAIAIGVGASATQEGAIALGKGSVANTASGTVGYDPSTKAASADTGVAWKSTTGALSLGAGTAAAPTSTRQITHVAAGTNDTDAVNVAQLKKTYVKTTYKSDGSLSSNNLATNDAGYVVDSGDDSTISILSNLSWGTGNNPVYKGDNIDVIRKSNGEFHIGFKEDPMFKTVQLGDANGPKLANDGGNIKVSGSNGTSPVKITNVATPSGDNDAANKAYVDGILPTITFSGDTGTKTYSRDLKQAAQREIVIKTGAGDYSGNAEGLSGANISTVVDNAGVWIGMKKAPTFDKVTLTNASPTLSDADLTPKKYVDDQLKAQTIAYKAGSDTTAKTTPLSTGLTFKSDDLTMTSGNNGELTFNIKPSTVAKADLVQDLQNEIDGKASKTTSYVFKTQNGSNAATTADTWTLANADEVTFKAGDGLTVSGANGVITYDLTQAHKTTLAKVAAGNVADNDQNTVTGDKVYDAVSAARTTVAKTGDILTVTGGDQAGIAGKSYTIGINESKLKEAAQAATNVTGTNGITVTPNTANNVKTYTIDGSALAKTDLSNLGNAGKKVITDIVTVTKKTGDDNILGYTKTETKTDNVVTGVNYELSLTKADVIAAIGNTNKEQVVLDTTNTATATYLSVSERDAAISGFEGTYKVGLTKAATDALADVANKANKTLDNIDDAGRTVIGKEAVKAVKVVKGTNVTVSPETAGTDASTVTYTISADNMKEHVKTSEDTVTTSTGVTKKTSDFLTVTPDNGTDNTYRNTYTIRLTDSVMKKLENLDENAKDTYATKNLDNITDEAKGVITGLTDVVADTTDTNNLITVTPTTDNGTKKKTYTLKVTPNTVAEKVSLTYKGNEGKTENADTSASKTTTLSAGLNFTSDDLTITAKDNGEVNLTLKEKSVSENELDDTLKNKLADFAKKDASNVALKNDGMEALKTAEDAAAEAAANAAEAKLKENGATPTEKAIAEARKAAETKAREDYRKIDPQATEQDKKAKEAYVKAQTDAKAWRDAIDVYAKSDVYNKTEIDNSVRASKEVVEVAKTITKDGQTTADDFSSKILRVDVTPATDDTAAKYAVGIDKAAFNKAAQSAVSVKLDDGTGRATDGTATTPDYGTGDNKVKNLATVRTYTDTNTGETVHYIGATGTDIAAGTNLKYVGNYTATNDKITADTTTANTKEVTLANGLKFSSEELKIVAGDNGEIVFSLTNAAVDKSDLSEELRNEIQTYAKKDASNIGSNLAEGTEKEYIANYLAKKVDEEYKKELAKLNKANPTAEEKTKALEDAKNTVKAQEAALTEAAKVEFKPTKDDLIAKEAENQKAWRDAIGITEGELTYTVNGVQEEADKKALDTAKDKKFTTTLKTGLNFNATSTAAKATDTNANPATAARPSNLTVSNAKDGSITYTLNETDVIDDQNLTGNTPLTTAKAVVDYINSKTTAKGENLKFKGNGDGSVADTVNLNSGTLLIDGGTGVKVVSADDTTTANGKLTISLTKEIATIEEVTTALKEKLTVGIQGNKATATGANATPEQNTTPLGKGIKFDSSVFDITTTSGAANTAGDGQPDNSTQGTVTFAIKDKAIGKDKLDDALQKDLADFAKRDASNVALGQTGMADSKNAEKTAVAEAITAAETAAAEKAIQEVEAKKADIEAQVKKELAGTVTEDAEIQKAVEKAVQEAKDKAAAVAKAAVDKDAVTDTARDTYRNTEANKAYKEAQEKAKAWRDALGIEATSTEVVKDAAKDDVAGTDYTTQVNPVTVRTTTTADGKTTYHIGVDEKKLRETITDTVRVTTKDKESALVVAEKKDDINERGQKVTTYELDLNLKNVSELIASTTREKGIITYTNAKGDRITVGPNGKLYKTTDLTGKGYVSKKDNTGKEVGDYYELTALDEQINGTYKLKADQADTAQPFAGLSDEEKKGIKHSLVSTNNLDATTVNAESTLDNIKDGKISSNSSEAVNGSQLYDLIGKGAFAAQDDLSTPNVDETQVPRFEINRGITPEKLAELQKAVAAAPENSPERKAAEDALNAAKPTVANNIYDAIEALDTAITTGNFVPLTYGAGANLDNAKEEKNSKSTSLKDGLRFTSRDLIIEAKENGEVNFKITKEGNRTVEDIAREKGTVVYTDAEGNRVAKGGDDKFYKPTDIENKVYVEGVGYVDNNKELVKEDPATGKYQLVEGVKVSETDPTKLVKTEATADPVEVGIIPTAIDTAKTPLVHSLVNPLNDGTTTASILRNVANGVKENDAVNVSQLKPLATALGTKIDETTGTVEAPKFAINAGGTNNNTSLTADNTDNSKPKYTYTTVQEALTALDKAKPVIIKDGGENIKDATSQYGTGTDKVVNLATVRETVDEATGQITYHIGAKPQDIEKNTNLTYVGNEVNATPKTTTLETGLKFKSEGLSITTGDNGELTFELKNSAVTKDDLNDALKDELASFAKQNAGNVGNNYPEAAKEAAILDALEKAEEAAIKAGIDAKLKEKPDATQAELIAAGEEAAKAFIENEAGLAKIAQDAETEFNKPENLKKVEEAAKANAEAWREAIGANKIKYRVNDNSKEVDATSTDNTKTYETTLENGFTFKATSSAVPATSGTTRAADTTTATRTSNLTVDKAADGVITYNLNETDYINTTDNTGSIEKSVAKTDTDPNHANSGTAQKTTWTYKADAPNKVATEKAVVKYVEDRLSVITDNIGGTLNITADKNPDDKNEATKDKDTTATVDLLSQNLSIKGSDGISVIADGNQGLTLKLATTGTEGVKLSYIGNQTGAVKETVAVGDGLVFKSDDMTITSADNGNVSFKIKDSVIGTNQIIDGSILYQDLSKDAVHAINIANQAVNGDKIADGAIGAKHLSPELSDLMGAAGNSANKDLSNLSPLGNAAIKEKGPVVYTLQDGTRVVRGGEDETKYYNAADIKDKVFVKDLGYVNKELAEMQNDGKYEVAIDKAQIVLTAEQAKELEELRKEVSKDTIQDTEVTVTDEQVEKLVPADTAQENLEAVKEKIRKELVDAEKVKLAQEKTKANETLARTKEKEYLAATKAKLIEAKRTELAGNGSATNPTALDLADENKVRLSLVDFESQDADALKNGIVLDKVADGKISGDSLEAINGSQLYDTIGEKAYADGGNTPKFDIKAGKELPTDITKQEKDLTDAKAAVAEKEAALKVAQEQNQDENAIAAAKADLETAKAKQAEAQKALDTAKGVETNVYDALKALDKAITTGTEVPLTYGAGTDVDEATKDAKTTTLKDGLKFVSKSLDITTGKNGIVRFKISNDDKTVEEMISSNGPVVYTNEAGEKVVKGKDGNLYKADEIKDKVYLENVGYVAKDLVATDEDGVEKLKDGHTAENVTKVTALPDTTKLVHTLATAKDGSTTTPSKLTNVADGTISGTSTDAINGSQLYDVVRNAEGVGNNLKDPVAEAAKAAEIQKIKDKLAEENAKKPEAERLTDNALAKAQEAAVKTPESLQAIAEAAKNAVEKAAEDKVKNDPANAGKSEAELTPIIDAAKAKAANDLAAAETAAADSAKKWRDAIDTYSKTEIDNITAASKETVVSRDADYVEVETSTTPNEDGGKEFKVGLTKAIKDKLDNLDENAADTYARKDASNVGFNAADEFKEIRELAAQAALDKAEEIAAEARDKKVNEIKAEAVKALEDKTRETAKIAAENEVKVQAAEKLKATTPNASASAIKAAQAAAVEAAKDQIAAAGETAVASLTENDKKAAQDLAVKENAGAIINAEEAAKLEKATEIAKAGSDAVEEGVEAISDAAAQAAEAELVAKKPTASEEEKAAARAKAKLEAVAKYDTTQANAQAWRDAVNVFSKEETLNAIEVKKEANSSDALYVKTTKSDDKVVYEVGIDEAELRNITLDTVKVSTKEGNQGLVVVEDVTTETDGKKTTNFVLDLNIEKVSELVANTTREKGIIAYTNEAGEKLTVGKDGNIYLTKDLEGKEFDADTNAYYSKDLLKREVNGTYTLKDEAKETAKPVAKYTGTDIKHSLVNHEQLNDETLTKDTVLDNIADGKISADSDQAINGSQLYDLIGAEAFTNKDNPQTPDVNEANTPKFELNAGGTNETAKSYDNVYDALKALDTAITKGETVEFHYGAGVGLEEANTDAKSKSTTLAHGLRFTSRDLILEARDNGEINFKITKEGNRTVEDIAREKGTVVYTQPDGTRVAKGTDNNFYKAEDIAGKVYVDGFGYVNNDDAKELDNGKYELKVEVPADTPKEEVEAKKAELIKAKKAELEKTLPTALNDTEKKELVSSLVNPIAEAGKDTTTAGKLTNIADGEISKDSTDAINGSQLFDLIGTIKNPADGTNGTDGRDGSKGVDGKDSTDGKDGAAGQDGLNGENLSEKIDALRRGEAGPVVYTYNDNGTDVRVTRGMDGKYYKHADIDDKVYVDGVGYVDKTEAEQQKDGSYKLTLNETELAEVKAGAEAKAKELDPNYDNLDDKAKADKLAEAEKVLATDKLAAKEKAIQVPTALTPEQANTIRHSLVNRDGNVDNKPSTLTNVGSGIGLENYGAEKTADKPAKYDSSTAEGVTKAQTDAAKLYDLDGTNLNNAATVGDLQAVSVAGLDFSGNNYDKDDTTKAAVVHRNLGNRVEIVGEGVDLAKSKAFTSAAGNINVESDRANNKLEIQLAKELTNLTSVEVKDDTTGSTAKLDGNGLTITPKQKDDATKENPNPKSVSITKDGISAGDNKITDVADGTVAKDSKDAINGGQLYAVKELIGDPATDGEDGRNGSNGADGTKADGTDGAAGKDGLNGQDLTEKVNALRRGEAGPVVYTDKDGNRIVRGLDGKYYTPESIKDKVLVDGIGYVPETLVTLDATGKNVLNEDGKQAQANDTLKDSLAKELDKDGIAGIKHSLVARDGSTTGEGSILTNVKDGEISDKSTDAINGSQLYNVTRNAEGVGNNLKNPDGFKAEKDKIAEIEAAAEKAAKAKDPTISPREIEVAKAKAVEAAKAEIKAARDKAIEAAAEKALTDVKPNATPEEIAKAKSDAIVAADKAEEAGNESGEKWREALDVYSKTEVYNKTEIDSRVNNVQEEVVHAESSKDYLVVTSEEVEGKGNKFTVALSDDAISKLNNLDANARDKYANKDASNVGLKSVDEEVEIAEKAAVDKAVKAAQDAKVQEAEAKVETDLLAINPNASDAEKATAKASAAQKAKDEFVKNDKANVENQAKAQFDREAAKAVAETTAKENAKNWRDAIDVYSKDEIKAASEIGNNQKSPEIIAAEKKALEDTLKAKPTATKDELDAAKKDAAIKAIENKLKAENPGKSDEEIAKLKEAEVAKLDAANASAQNWRDAIDTYSKTEVYNKEEINNLTAASKETVKSADEKYVTVTPSKDKNEFGGTEFVVGLSDDIKNKLDNLDPDAKNKYANKDASNVGLNTLENAKDIKDAVNAAAKAETAKIEEKAKTDIEEVLKAEALKELQDKTKEAAKIAEENRIKVETTAKVKEANPKATTAEIKAAVEKALTDRAEEIKAAQEKAVTDLTPEAIKAAEDKKIANNQGKIIQAQEEAKQEFADKIENAKAEAEGKALENAVKAEAEKLYDKKLAEATKALGENPTQDQLDEAKAKVDELKNNGKLLDEATANVIADKEKAEANAEAWRNATDVFSKEETLNAIEVKKADTSSDALYVKTNKEADKVTYEVGIDEAELRNITLDTVKVSTKEGNQGLVVVEDVTTEKDGKKTTNFVLDLNIEKVSELVANTTREKGIIAYTNEAGEKLTVGKDGNIYKVSELNNKEYAEDAKGYYATTDLERQVNGTYILKAGVNPDNKLKAYENKDIRHSLVSTSQLDNDKLDTPSVLNNVADGKVTAESTEAINGSQLYNVTRNAEGVGNNLKDPVAEAAKAAEIQKIKDKLAEENAKKPEAERLTDNDLAKAQEAAVKTPESLKAIAEAAKNAVEKAAEDKVKNDPENAGKSEAELKPIIDAAKAQAANDLAAAETAAANSAKAWRDAIDTYSKTEIDARKETVVSSTPDYITVDSPNTNTDGGKEFRVGMNVDKMQELITNTVEVTSKQKGVTVNGSASRDGAKDKIYTVSIDKTGYGADITTNDTNTPVEQEIGTNISIVSAKTEITKDGAKYVGNNLVTRYTQDANGNGTVEVALKEKPTFTEITVGGITINEGGTKTITGLTTGDDESSAVTKGYVDSKLNTAGRVQLTDAEGNRVIAVEGEDDKTYYVYIDKEGKQIEGTKPLAPEAIVNSMVSPTNSTKEPTRLANIAEGILPTDAVNKAQLDRVDRKAEKALDGVAHAVAMANLPQINDAGSNKHNLAASVGHYEGRTAVAVGVSGISDTGRVIYKASASVDNKKQFAVGAGLGYQIGQRNVTGTELERLQAQMTLLQYERKAETDNLRDKLAQEIERNNANTLMIQQLFQEIERLKQAK